MNLGKAVLDLRTPRLQSSGAVSIGQVFHFIELVFWIYPITWTLSSIVYLLVYRKLQVPLFERQK